jgi:Rha family phage regulatory protein
MKLVFIDNKRIVTDSLIVAETFGKEHKHILRDIRELECSHEFAQSNFGLSDYTDSTGRTLPKYLISQDGFSFLVMGYTGKEAARFKEMYINEFNRMREELTKPQSIMPTNLLEAAERWISELKRNEYLESTNKQLALETEVQKQKLKEQEAPVAIYNLAISAHNTMSMQEVAKAMGTGRTRLYEILREEQLITKGSTLPYQRFIDAGYFKVTERPRASGDTIVNDPATRVTAKGFDYIGKLMHKRAEREKRMKEFALASAEIAASQVHEPILQ